MQTIVAKRNSKENQYLGLQCKFLVIATLLKVYSIKLLRQLLLFQDTQNNGSVYSLDWTMH